MKKSIVSATALSFMLVVFNISPVFADTQVQDHYKNVIHKTPHSVEVCYDKSVSGDKTGDTLRGAILGGIIGNNVGDINNGGAIGSVIGGMLGHSNSNATGGTKRVCQIETRYTEKSMRIYSHSKITFEYMGKTYTLQFEK
jgi:uncharacterized protein YcfJ|tara:strand:- start:1357 stop:1779 length:423 start_codon:yes stop_codon:yes gene_type:complete